MADSRLRANTSHCLAIGGKYNSILCSSFQCHAPLKTRRCAWKRLLVSCNSSQHLAKFCKTLLTTLCVGVCSFTINCNFWPRLSLISTCANVRVFQTIQCSVYVSCDFVSYFEQLSCSNRHTLKAFLVQSFLALLSVFNINLDFHNFIFVDYFLHRLERFVWMSSMMLFCA